MGKKNNIEHSIFILVKTFSIILIVLSLFTQNWMLTYNALLTLAVAFLPQILYKRWNIVYPSTIDISVLLFVVGCLIFGEAFNFYYVFPMWDVALHTMSGVLIALIAFIMVKHLNDIDVRVMLSPIFVAIFAVSFAMFFGGVWEIIEYMSDIVLGTNMQKSGLDDTMQDLIVALVGSAAVSIMGYFYLKYGTSNIVGKMMEEENDS